MAFERSLFKTFNRCAPFKPFKGGMGSRIQSKICLKFARDRERYLYWVFKAKNRYGLSVLDYMITSNHIHLLVKDTGQDVIAQSMQLMVGILRSRRRRQRAETISGTQISDTANAEAEKRMA